MTHAARPKAWLAWSSGKDAAWALHAVGGTSSSRVSRRGDTPPTMTEEIEVIGLLTTITAPYDRVSMHGVRRELVEAQARAAGLPLHKVLIPAPCSNETYEAAMAEAMATAKSLGVSRMVFGDLFLEDVRRYREEKLAPTGIQPVFPLWGLDTRALAREMIAAGLRAYVTCLDPRKLPRELAGRPFDQAFLDALPDGVDPCAERGEFHTFACAGPMFAQPIPVRVGETVEREGFVFADLIHGASES
ncbi:MAG TPA: adenine nucleotide alpha hydrolase [Planctomycetota bacterium]|nr:adenine nucleotide alpha hydrolase [Planctomycetota bacterium]HRR82046.1 adenine nucleotide alpha hydrolase [Planctomycetota bacterium]HRT94531.1 adenine nucleotide alpha hydrolase [Planctomycetota bacterium]